MSYDLTIFAHSVFYQFFYLFYSFTISISVEDHFVKPAKTRQRSKMLAFALTAFEELVSNCVEDR